MFQIKVGLSLVIIDVVVLIIIISRLSKENSYCTSSALLICLGLLILYLNAPIAGKMLGQVLVTKQTGPQGKVVSKVGLITYS